MLIKKIKEFISKFLIRVNDSSLFYVGSTDKLPEPLKKDEEEKLILKAMENDKQAIDSLIEHNLRLVVFLSKKYENTKIDLEDLVSIGTIGLIKGIKTYKLDKSIKLATYASRCIDNEILMFLRKNKRRRMEISFEDSLSYDAEGNELHLEDILGTPADIVTKGLDEQIDKTILKEELSKLKDRDKEIMSLRYGIEDDNSLTQKEVADFLNISQSYISRIEKKIIKDIKNRVKL